MVSLQLQCQQGPEAVSLPPSRATLVLEAGLGKSGKRYMDSALSLSSCEVSLSINICQTFQIWDTHWIARLLTKPFFPSTTLIFYPYLLRKATASSPSTFLWSLLKSFSAHFNVCHSQSSWCISSLTQGSSGNHRRQTLCLTDFKTVRISKRGFRKGKC